MPDAFVGFPADFFAFFRELRANNARDWFEANKPRFRDSVQAPMSAFITAIAPRLAEVSPHFVADPRPNGGSMFRIYRDVRFAKDKRPYKEHAACQFRHESGRDAHAPGFYLHLGPDEVRFGGGLWMPPPDALLRTREAISRKPDAWKAATSGKAFTERLGDVRGEQLARPPRGFDPNLPYIDDIRRKSFFFMSEGDEALARSPALVDAVGQTFKAAGPLMQFLCGAVGAAY